MGRHLILAVHGIGEQKPGDTVDAIVGAAATDHIIRDENGDISTRQSNGPVDVQRDLIELPETDFDGNPRKARLFPVHLRRVRPARPGNSTDEALFAEVFWADKSPAPNGFFWTAFDLLKVILGLGYIGMDNVENTRTRASVVLFHAFTWAFYGLVAPLNAILLIGAVLLLLDPFVFEIGTDVPTAAILLAQGGVALAIALLIRQVVRSTYLVAIFRRGLGVFGALIVLIWASFQIPALGIIATGIEGGYQIAGPLLGLDPGPLCVAPSDPDQFSAQADPNGGLECFVTHTITALELSWFLTISLGFLVLILSPFLPRLNTDATTSTVGTLYPAIAGAMLMFWMIFTSSFWLLFGYLVRTLAAENGQVGNGAPVDPDTPVSFLDGIFKRQFVDAQDTLGLSVYTLGVFLVVAGLLVVARSLSTDTLRKPESAPLISRVILNPAIALVLNGFVVAVFLLVLALAFTTTGLPKLMKDAADWMMALVAFDAERNGTIGAIALGLGILIYNFPSVVAGGLGVARDIVTYAVQEHCICRIRPRSYRANFILRNDINSRFERVLRHSLQTFAPDRVTVISHSQGTVIATQMLQRRAVRDLFRENGKPALTLITMGSPVTQVYRHYFPTAFQVQKDRMPPGTTWSNIYRIDDYVGTRIAEDTGVDQNLDVGPAGHLGYFTDHEVWKRLWQDVKFRLF